MRLRSQDVCVRSRISAGRGAFAPCPRAKRSVGAEIAQIAVKCTGVDLDGGAAVCSIRAV